MFRIEFNDASEAAGASENAYGRITVGDHSESFEANLGHWSREMYEKQWRDAAGRLLTGEDRSAFFTSLAPPRSARFAVWWPAWREDQRIWMTEQFLLFDQLGRPFDEIDPYKHVGEREHISEGQRISYWRVPVESFREFLNNVSV